MISYHYIELDVKPIKNKNRWLNEVISKENKKLGDLTFIFCDDKYLLEKNIKFLKHNTLTDVITFDYSEGKQINGDIFISLDRVKENSKIFKVTFLQELDRVIIHGLLHLLGYKDKTKNDSKIMRSKENFYLSIK